MADIIEKINGSDIQHGPHNNRIYLMRLNARDTYGLIAALDGLALKNGYEKIFARIPAPAWNAFKSADYRKDAVIPGFFNGNIDGFFIAKYFSTERQAEQNVENQSTIFKKPAEEQSNPFRRTVTAAYDVDTCKISDAEEMGTIYSQAFESYPFPIQEPEYLRQMMEEGVLYFCIRIKSRIAALASAEIDFSNKNTEMTDFATVPACRGLGLAGRLLDHMDIKTRTLGIKTAYSIARTSSIGMNTVFKNSGYKCAGILKNNSQICGSIQSMTVWYKHL